MGLHLSLFDVKKVQQGEVPTEKWIDLECIATPRWKEEGGAYGLKRRQGSLMIVGTNDLHWTAYCFDDRDPDDELDEDDFTYNSVQVDPIVSQYGDNIIDANTPIRDPRAYFLRVWSRRTATVLAQWENLVWLTETGINSQVSRLHQS